MKQIRNKKMSFYELATELLKLTDDGIAREVLITNNVFYDLPKNQFWYRERKYKGRWIFLIAGILSEYCILEGNIFEGHNY